MVKTCIGRYRGLVRLLVCASGPLSHVIDFAFDPVPVALNGDAKVDLLLAGGLTGSGPSGLVVSFGNGDGTFQAATYYQTGADRNATWIAVGDFNADGIVDAATLGESGVCMFTGKAGGTFISG